MTNGEFGSLANQKRGDIPFHRGGGQWDRKPIGTAGQFLWVSGGLPVWHTLVGTDIAPDTITAAQIASRTRFLYLPASLWHDAGTGTPALSTYGTGNTNFQAWALDGTSDEAIGCEVLMPADWDLGTINWAIIWAPSDTNTGNVELKMRVTSVAETEAWNIANESDTGFHVSAASGVQYARTTLSFAALAPGTGSSSYSLRLLVYRFSSDSLDTYDAHDALIVGVVGQYTADM